MKKIISILIIGLTISCSTTKNIQQKEGLNVKTIYEASYSAKRSGEMIRETALKDKADRMEIYDENGNLVEYWKYETDGTIYEKTKLEKDNNGKLLRSETFDNTSKLKRYLETEFDSNGNIQFYRTYNSEKELTSIQENQYDKNGNVILVSSTTISSNRTFKTESKYNSKNQLIEGIDYKPDGTLRDTRTFKYDESGNEIESELTRPNGDFTKFISTYDKHTNILTQYWFDRDGNQKHWNNWEYNYDKNENWITKKRFSKGELGYVWERKIEYQ